MTNLIVLPTASQFMNDFTPSYAPLYALLLGKSQSYSETIGTQTFKRLNAIGDLRAKNFTPKDTVFAQVSAREGSKAFSKYFLANQFTHSNLQDAEGVQSVAEQILEEHNKQADDLLLTGGGTSVGTVKNNGLYWSADANYVLNSSAEVANDNSWLTDLHSKIVAQAEIADQVPGRKVVVLYGSSTIAKAGGVYATSSASFKKVLADALGQDYAPIAKIPSAVTPASAEGFMIINLDAVKLHYTTLPKMLAQGINEEKMYAWMNFIMGSMMVEVLQPGGIIRQPLTFEAAA